MTHEVTVEEFQRFQTDWAYSKQHSPEPDCPMNGLSWYNAAAYCNWLSQRDGIPKEQWCYLPKVLPDGSEQYAAGMRSAPDFLERTGYRLPTEAEWEYACRAGATTSRYFGQSDDLLEEYAQYAKSASDPRTVRVGSLKPNDLGLFDMQGNVLEWCHEEIREYSVTSDGESGGIALDGSEVNDRKLRVLRGGSFNNPSLSLRSAKRSRAQPSLKTLFVGMRAARTYR